VQKFTTEDAEKTSKTIGVDWNKEKFKVEDLRIGMDVELEHGTENNLTNVTNDDPVMTAKIALAHLLESPIYYKLLEEMEEKFD